MIEAGVGVLIVEEKHLRRFNKLMIDFYETADKSKSNLFYITTASPELTINN